MATSDTKPLPRWKFERLLQTNPDFPEQVEIKPKSLTTKTGLNETYVTELVEPFVEKVKAHSRSNQMEELFEAYRNLVIMCDRISSYIQLRQCQDTSNEVLEEAEKEQRDYFTKLHNELLSDRNKLVQSSYLEQEISEQDNDYTNKISQLSDQTTQWQSDANIVISKEEKSVSDAFEDLRSVSRSEQITILEGIQKAVEEDKDKLLGYINGAREAKQQYDEAKGYRHPSEHLNSQSGFTTNDEQEWLNTCSSSENPDNFAAQSQNFFSIKAALNHDGQLLYPDLKNPLPLAKSKITFDDCKESILKSFSKFLPEDDVKLVAQYFDEKSGLLDAASYPNRQSEYSFAENTSYTPSYISNIFRETARSVTYLAHEFGHAVNANRSLKSRNMEELPTIADEMVAVTTETICALDLMENAGDIYREIDATANFLNSNYRSLVEFAAYTEFENFLHTSPEMPDAELLEQKWVETQKKSFGKSFNTSLSRYDFYMDPFLTYPYYSQSYSKSACLALAIAGEYIISPETFADKFQKLIEEINAPGKKRTLKDILQDQNGFALHFPDAWNKGQELMSDKLAKLQNLLAEEKELAEYLREKIKASQKTPPNISFAITGADIPKLKRLGFDYVTEPTANIHMARVREILTPHALLKQQRLQSALSGAVSHSQQSALAA